MNDLFNKANKQIDKLSAETVEDLAQNMLKLESNPRFAILRERLTDKLNQTCVSLCNEAKELNSFSHFVVKQLYDQLRMVVIAQNKLDKFFCRTTSKLLLTNEHGKLIVQSELKEIMSTKIDRIVAEAYSKDIDAGQRLARQIDRSSAHQRCCPRSCRVQ